LVRCYSSFHRPVRGRASDNLHIGAHAINAKVTFSCKQRQNSPRWPADLTRPVRGREEATPPVSKAALRVQGHQARLRMPDLLHMPGGDYLYRQAQTSRCENKWGYPQSPARSRSSVFAPPVPQSQSDDSHANTQVDIQGAVSLPGVRMEGFSAGLSAPEGSGDGDQEGRQGGPDNSG
jgi:hypothetical protein